MRLARLNLTRYGKFTGSFIDFGPREPGKPDFHIIYGPNEAGKTTTVTAYLDLLFGIEKNSAYKFLHGYDTMQVGGVLEFAGGTREFVRVKKAANSLLDGRGQTVSESALAGELGGLDRAEYRLKFSLDAEKLETGGDDILASKGDLGELLFAASAGVADLSQKLAKMREDSEKFYRKGARRHELADLKVRLKELDEKKQAIDTLAFRYAKLVADRKAASDLYEKALKDRAEADAAKSKIVRMENALPRLRALKGLVDKLKPLADVPEAPPRWKEKVARLQKQVTGLEANLQTAIADIQRLTREIDEIVVDETALGLADRLADLDGERARYLTAEDIPKLRPQVAVLNAQIAGVLRVLERDGEKDPQKLLLGASVTVALRGLIEKWAGVETGLRNAEAECSKAQTILEEEKDKLAAAQARAGGAEPAALAALGSVLADIRGHGLETGRDMALEALAQSREDFAGKLKLLAPWRGVSTDLIMLRVPDATCIAQWKMALGAAEKAVENRAEDADRLTTELTSLHAKKAAFEATSGVVSDGEAARARAEREAAWAEHRRALSKDTADFFEERLRADDLATVARIAHSKEAAQVNETLQTIMIREQELERAQERHREAVRKRDLVRAEIAAAITAVSSAFADNMTLTELEAWTSRRAMALEVGDAVRRGELRLREAEAAIAEALARLGKAMGKAGVASDPDDGLGSLMLAAQAALDEATAIRSQSEILDGAGRALARRQADLSRARGEADSWRTEWNDACGRCWIAENRPEPSIPLVREILLKIDELRPLLSNRAGLEERIEKMERDQAAFADSVAALAAEIGEGADGRPILVVDGRISARVKEAGEKKLIRLGKLKDLAEARRREDEHREDIARSEEEAEEVLSFFAVETLAAAAEKLDEAKARSDLLERKAEEERLITEALGVDSMEEAEAILAGADPAELSMEKARAENLFDDADARQREYYLAQSNADKQIDSIGGDEAVALIEEQRRTICLEIEDKARDWLRMRAGVIAAEQALRVYREKHRSSMMANASEAFRTISRGAYARLTTQPDGDGEVLVAVGADGRSKKANDLELSKGTRFQLYLALRVAGYQEYALSRQPPWAVPFVADDIMETFDNFRAEEAFRLLAKMGEIGQVIYLTHHEHLCGIAKKVCPDVRIHNL